MFTTSHSPLLMGAVPTALFFGMMIAAWPASAIGPAQIDDFEDGSTMGWTEGAPSPNPPANTPTSGPRGVGDAYVENSSAGGSGPGSRMVMFNRSQWTGDFAAAGVMSVRGHFINLGTNPLPLRVGIEGAGGGRYVTTAAAILPADATWYEIHLALSETAMTLVGGSQPLASVLTGVTELRFLASADPDWSGDAMVAALGIDNVAVGALIFVDGFDSGDVALWTPPAVADDAFTAVASVPLSIPAAGVLGNDHAPGYSHPSAVLVSPPVDPSASVVVEPDGSFVYRYDAPVPFPVVDTFTYRADSGLDGVATVTVNVVPDPTLAEMRVFYRLDPWLIPSPFGSEVWVSPISFGPARQTGDVFVLELRAAATNDGAPVPANPTWIPEDPSMVTTSPSSGDRVTMTVWKTGESNLAVDSQGVRTTMTVSVSRFQDTAMEVTIYQP